MPLAAPASTGLDREFEEDQTVVSASSRSGDLAMHPLKMNLNAAVVLGVSMLFFSISSPACGQLQWIEWPVIAGGNGHWYAESEFGTWQEVQAQAEAVGGDLVTINDLEENQWLFATFVPPPTCSRFWIGLYQIPGSPEPGGGWVWISGDPSTFRNWQGGEPNNLGGQENWAELVHDGEWNDLGPTHPCFVKAGIIEREDEPVSCPGDINEDGEVDVSDLLLLLAGWGPCPPVCIGDINDDGVVNVQDLLQLLSEWGPCP
jgi:hypothetical protein